MVNKMDELIYKIQEKGLDCFINNGFIYIFGEGFISDVPLDNVLKLFNYEFQKLNIDTIVTLLISNHKMKSLIESGIYNDLPPMSDEEFKNSIINAMNKNK